MRGRSHSVFPIRDKVNCWGPIRSFSRTHHEMNLADDMAEFVAVHRGHGHLTADAGEPTPNGYRLEIAWSCGVTFERWVTELDAIEDLVRDHLRGERN